MRETYPKNLPVSLEKSGKLPTRKHTNDAGLDIYSLEETSIPAGGIAIIRSGVHLELPEGTVGLLLPKSRNNWLVMAGVVDCSYRGEILVKLFSPTDVKINVGDAIAQMLIFEILTPIPEEGELTDTERGSTGGIVSQKRVMRNGRIELLEYEVEE